MALELEFVKFTRPLFQSFSSSPHFATLCLSVAACVRPCAFVCLSLSGQTGLESRFFYSWLEHGCLFSRFCLFAAASPSAEASRRERGILPSRAHTGSAGQVLWYEIRNAMKLQGIMHDLIMLDRGVQTLAHLI